jgi:hypothetical protein
VAAEDRLQQQYQEAPVAVEIIIVRVEPQVQADKDLRAVTELELLRTEGVEEEDQVQ